MPQGKGKMPEDTNVGESQTNDTVTESSEQATDAEALKAELAKAQARIKELNAESAGRRKAIEAYEAKEKKAKDAELTEAQKYQAQAQEWQEKAASYEAQIQAMALKHAVERAAAQKGFVNPADALRLADLSGVGFEDGEPDGKAIEEALGKLAKASPYLLAQTQQQASINAADGRGASRSGQSAAARDEEIVKKYRLRR